MDEQHYLDIVRQAMDEKREEVVVHFDLDWFTAFTLLGHLQLALRHPRNTGASTRIVRDCAISPAACRRRWATRRSCTSW